MTPAANAPSSILRPDTSVACSNMQDGVNGSNEAKYAGTVGTERMESGRDEEYAMVCAIK